MCDCVCGECVCVCTSMYVCMCVYSQEQRIMCLHKGDSMSEVGLQPSAKNLSINGLVDLLSLQEWQKS